MSEWEVVGGSHQGGIVVRKGVELKSAAFDDRLSKGSVVSELKIKGDRLHYKLLTGSGPEEGWVSLTFSGKVLMKRKDDNVPSDWGSPGRDAGDVRVDEDLRNEVLKMAEEKKQEGALPLYAMKYKVYKYPLDGCKLRVFCFHNAGSAESAFTGPNTTFINWCNKEAKCVEAIAMDYPGRDKLLKVKAMENTQELAKDLLAVVYDFIADGVPYVLWGHSVGTWVAFEFAILARKIGLPMPKAAFMMAFPAPHLPWASRPWPRSRKQSDEELKKTLTDWDSTHYNGPGKVVFDEPLWTDTWKVLMRADFQLYDEYRFMEKDAPKFRFPIHAWHMKEEYYNKKHMIEMWQDWTTGEFDHCELEGMTHLTCLYKPERRKIYFEKIVETMKNYVS